MKRSEENESMGKPADRHESILEAKYRSLMDGISDAVLITDTAGNMLEVNAALEQLSEHKQEELLAMCLEKLHPKLESEKVHAFFTELLQAGKADLSETLLLTKKGKMLPVALSGSVAVLPGKRIALVFMRDLTKYKQDKAQISHLACFPELSPNPIIEVDFAGHVNYTNSVAARLFPGIHTAGFGHPFLAGLESHEVVFLREKKDFILREIRIGDIYYQQTLCFITERQSIHVYGIDITDLKKAQAEALQSEKLSVLGKFAACIMHDVCNPLQIILGGIGLLEERMSGADEKIKTTLEKIKEATGRANEISRRLLKFSKPFETKTEEVTPRDLIKETVALLKYNANLSGIEIRTDFSAFDDKACMKVDKNQLQEGLFNIIMNAADAMPKGGTVFIKTCKTTMPHSDAAACAIEIRDEGTGIAKGDMAKLFEPFFTTKGKRGTGLGLAATKMIVNNHKGAISVDSEINKGTEVRIILPLA